MVRILGLGYNLETIDLVHIVADLVLLVCVYLA
jgi:hypothetical protein